MIENISFKKSEEAWRGYDQFLSNLIKKNNTTTVCEIGAGANPLFDVDFIKENELNYSILDISKKELDKAPDHYNKILADIVSPEFVKSSTKYDLIFSMMLAEHVTDARRFHENIFDLLTDGGIAVHFFPTLYTIPFLVNYLMPERLADSLLNIMQPRDRIKHAKFPAYYKWCRGPTKRQLRKLASVGYNSVDYIGFFGHRNYYEKIKVFQRIHDVKTQYLLRHPLPYFTSYAYIVLRRT